jgi:DNA invertase Pin-like site-specific DNA recombinase
VTCTNARCRRIRVRFSARPGTIEGLEAARARGRTGGRKPKLTARQVIIARQMCDEKGPDSKRRYTVAKIAETFHVSRKTIYRHLAATSTSPPPA